MWRTVVHVSWPVQADAEERDGDGSVENPEHLCKPERHEGEDEVHPESEVEEEGPDAQVCRPDSRPRLEEVVQPPSCGSQEGGMEDVRGEAEHVSVEELKDAGNGEAHAHALNEHTLQIVHCQSEL